MISRHHLNVFPTASLYYISILKVLLIFACVYITSQKLKVCNFSKVKKNEYFVQNGLRWWCLALTRHLLFTIKVISSLLFITSKFSKSLAQLHDSLYYYILVFQFKSFFLKFSREPNQWKSEKNYKTLGCMKVWKELQKTRF